MKLKDIFASKTQVKLLVFFTDNPRKEYYQTELCKKLNESLGSIQYEVNRLVRMGFLNKRKSKVRTFYSLNSSFNLLDEIKSIIKKVGK
jgi:DNA-binding MarR family transcriptional regulator